MKWIIGVVLAGILVFVACKGLQKNNTSDEHPKRITGSTQLIISGQIVEKDFINKVGKSAGFKELYFRCSEQDYFIKFCESDVTKQDLLEFVDHSSVTGCEIVGETVNLEIEVCEGYWDICPEDTHHIQGNIHTQIFDPWAMAVPMVCLDSCLLLAFKSYSHKREIL